MDYMKDYNNWKLDEFSISRELFKYICENLDRDKIILELGSGPATGLLSKYYTVYSVENDKKWINKYKSKYIHVPLKHDDNPVKTFPMHKYWYNGKILKEKIKDIKYDLLLIDGPKKFRSGLLRNLDIIDKNAIIIFDDTHRESDCRIMEIVAKKLKKKKEHFKVKNNSSFCVLK